ncbi:MAG: MazG nucleotide pyrophosphohydrolase domain-containing protein [Candidatus Kariarchaeaceae archaeon]|jgi:NTP pyrophosphatase (non-canonical NTP hydrolase)
MPDTTFADLRERVFNLNKSNSSQWPVEWQLIWIFEELGEVAGEIIKLSKLGGRWNPEKDDYDVSALKEELGDLMYGIISLAENVEIDLLQALKATISKFENRKKNKLN